jgi:hypothetical protein
MSEAQDRKLTAKTVVLVIAVSIITALVVTLLQTLLIGKANIAVTGAVTAVPVLSTIRKK